jgi:penicillin-binding protein 2
MASAALQEKIISPEKTIYDPGFIEVPNQYNPNIVYRFMDWKPHGTVNLRKAIAVSCNVYFYTIGGGYNGQEGLGAERIEKYLKLFGWGSKTGIDLPGEKTGLIPDPTWKKENIGENWYTGDTYHLSIGQGYLTATPLQVVTAFSAIANGGILYEPRLVQKIIDSQKDTFEELKPEIIRENFIDPKNLQIVREGMREGVTYGSSVILNDLPVNSAAKTGTAETGKENVYHNWVTVFAPYEDPQIVLTIVIENVPGAQVAALPIAKNILAWYFSKNK